MGNLVLNGATSGQLTIAPPAVAGTNTLTIPAKTGNLITSADSATVTPAMLSQPLTAMTAQASTSGSVIDFTGIPSWAKRVTIIYSALSTNGANDVGLRLGTSSGFDTTGYAGSIVSIANGLSPFCINTTAFAQITYATNAGVSAHGTAVLTLLNSSTNLWVITGTYGRSDATGAGFFGYSKSLSGVLTQVRLFSADTFDAGSINVFYE